MTIRRDVLRALIDAGHATDSSSAEELIEAKRVRESGRVVLNPRARVDPGQLHVADEPPKYASRGGLKLERALARFDVAVDGRTCLDIGASTGGFTDCLLQHGAAVVHAVDVGFGQLLPRLADDPRVHVHDRTNIRDVEPARFGDARPDLAVMDVSFTAAGALGVVVAALLDEPSDWIALVKPQFELPRDRVPHGGVVTNTGDHRESILSVAKRAAKEGWSVVDGCASPITGASGNIEFLLHLTFGHDAVTTRSERDMEQLADAMLADAAAMHGGAAA